MNKYRLRIFTCVALCAALIALSGCTEIGKNVTPPRKKSILAIVYADLTKSINETTANRQKRNIETLFQRLPYDAKFYLYSIDRGASKPSIYEFLPTFTPIVDTETEELVQEEIEKTIADKKGTELEKLKSSLDSYHASIAREKGPVSCISNKLNGLIDTINVNKAPEYDIRIYFYSDMIEQCQNSFDAKPLDFERYDNDSQEAKHLADIQGRIDKNFEQANPKRNLKSMDAKVYIILTSQDDKQSLKTLKTIWSNFFGKLGLSSDEIVWANNNGDGFWTLDSTPLSAQK